MAQQMVKATQKDAPSTPLTACVLLTAGGYGPFKALGHWEVLRRNPMHARESSAVGGEEADVLAWAAEVHRRQMGALRDGARQAAASSGLAVLLANALAAPVCWRFGPGKRRVVPLGWRGPRGDQHPPGTRWHVEVLHSHSDGFWCVCARPVQRLFKLQQAHGLYALGCGFGFGIQREGDFGNFVGLLHKGREA